MLVKFRPYGKKHSLIAYVSAEKVAILKSLMQRIPERRGKFLSLRRVYTLIELEKDKPFLNGRTLQECFCGRRKLESDIHAALLIWVNDKIVSRTERLNRADKLRRGFDVGSN